MNIEESIKPLKILMSKYKQIYEMNNFDHELALVIDYTELSAIETLLTAYEKEKGENVKLRLQDIPLIEGELKAYKDRVNELKAELEKEKEKNRQGKMRIVQLENEITARIEDVNQYYTPNDKIKAKIEEFEKQQKEEPDAYLCIKALSSLLEKE